ncbi:radical SAM protein [Photobacterium sp. MCCC 1A19761]|uniref:radical SAM protein n=1 Tax=Photobacterium sp. MCCC 1A19761 TaxID=3115000 RepID=UPI00307DB6F9
MQTKTQQKLDEHSFARLKARVKQISSTQRGLRQRADWAAEMPHQVGVKMNNQCNLRCQHCFEWNDEGYHHQMERDVRSQEVDLAIIDKLLRATESTQAPFYLWGGEPLMYKQMEALMDRFVEHPRWVTICTNGLLIEKHLAQLSRIDERLALLISLDGLEAENDAIRGKGVFRRVERIIRTLLEQRQRQAFAGKVSLCLTISDSTVGKLFEFVRHFSDLGIDSVYLVFPWYIPPQVAEQMDQWVGEQLPWKQARPAGTQEYSWHGYTYHLSDSNIPALLDDIARISAQTWDCRVRFHPNLEPHEVPDFVAGSTKPAENKTFCSAIRNRLDVLPNGDVTSCKFFPELEVGNLQLLPVREVWHSAAYQAFRKQLHCGLMPVCAKCTLLYSTG